VEATGSDATSGSCSCKRSRKDRGPLYALFAPVFPAQSHVNGLLEVFPGLADLPVQGGVLVRVEPLPAPAATRPPPAPFGCAAVLKRDLLLASSRTNLRRVGPLLQWQQSSVKRWNGLDERHATSL